MEPHETRTSTACMGFADSNSVIEEMPVLQVRYRKLELRGKPSMMVVSYFCGATPVKEVVCLEHDGFAGRKALQWWMQRSTDLLPETVDEALEQVRVLRVPIAIKVAINRKYPLIVEYIWRIAN